MLGFREPEEDPPLDYLAFRYVDVVLVVQQEQEKNDRRRQKMCTRHEGSHCQEKRESRSEGRCV